MNYTACAGDDVTFTCTTTTPEVMWQINNAYGMPAASYYYDSLASISDTQTTVGFTFNKTGNYTFTLTFLAGYDLDGYWVQCTDVVFAGNYTNNVTTSTNTTETCPIRIPGNDIRSLIYYPAICS